MLGGSKRRMTAVPGHCSSPICAPSHHQTVPRCPLHPSVVLPVPGCCTTPPKLCHLGGEAGCQADCSIQLALISPSASGSLSCSSADRHCRVMTDSKLGTSLRCPTGKMSSAATVTLRNRKTMVPPPQLSAFLRGALRSKGLGR